ncbi:hypothetical protein GCM10012275_52730 [Longimycelium tulufanense]|uniref:Uncharacterized protein n=1 Tax=Longimycelium tulufanense TaxID=907463 RepID=A0A8J3FXM9_9PSEU|nr:hypothetical protein [Longimycelium tulufanense]GGM75502.1 hypothetical protein GCM10012275_52730 [Longimycelium tulufanense]
MGKTYKFDRYVQEAKAEPFVLDAGDVEIVIQPPDGETVLEIEQCGSTRVMLELMCGDQFDAVYELVRSQPASVLRDLSLDMARHFSIAPDQAPPGGLRASSRR